MSGDFNANTHRQKGNDAQYALSEGGWYLLCSEGA
jgi:hypothetical protein